MVETVSAGRGEARLTEESKVGGRVGHLSFTVSGLQIYGEDCGVLLLSMAEQRGPCPPSTPRLMEERLPCGVYKDGFTIPVLHFLVAEYAGQREAVSVLSCTTRERDQAPRKAAGNV